MVRNEDDPLHSQIASLRRQLRIVQVGAGSALCILTATAAVKAPEVIHARGISIDDLSGRPLILIGNTSSASQKARPGDSSSIVIKNEVGRTRVIIGREPDPVLGGKPYPRRFPGWGTLIYAPDGSERGGFNYLDGRGASLAIDRPTGDAMGLLVDERANLAAFVLNYDNGGKIGTYPTALEVGTKGARAFVEARNRDGSSAGSLVALGAGPASLSNEVDQDRK